MRKLFGRNGKRFLRTILMLALAATLSLGVLSVSYAEGEIVGSEESPAEAAVRKLLKMPAGTTTPGATFTFAFEKKFVDGLDDTDSLTSMPAISSKQVVYTAADVGTTTGDVKSVSKEVLALTSTESSAFPHAGVYEYEITEQQTGYIITDPAKESLTYSPGIYTIRFYVRDEAEGSGIYVHAIGVDVTTVDNNDQTAGTKVDPTPGGGSSGGGSGLVFTNVYMKSGGGGTPTDPANRNLTISKAVSGDYADRTKYFTYSLTVNKPSLVTETSAYKAYIVDGSNTVVTALANGTVVEGDLGGYINVTADSATTIKLKHGQSIVFTDLPVGASYVAVESGETLYAPLVTMVVDGATTFDRTSLEGASLSTGPSTSTAGTVLVGESTNTASFVNANRSVTPTGLVIDNLPFIVLLVVSVGSLVIFLAAKTRKRREE